MIRAVALLLMLAAPVTAETTMPATPVCETVGMLESDGSLMAFPTPGQTFTLDHDGRDVAPSPNSPFHGFPAMIASTWDDALERFLQDHGYRIALFLNGLTDAGGVIVHHYPVAGVFEVGMRDNAFVHHCGNSTAPAS